MGLHEDVHRAVCEAVRGMTLDGVDTARDVHQQEFEDWKVLRLPAVSVSVGGLTEESRAFDSETDEWIYPVRVAIGERSDMADQRRREVHTEWRQALARRFERQRLPVVPEVWDVSVRLEELAETEEPRYQAWVSRFVVLPRALIPRPVFA
jgi:hypothetical protein